MQTSWQIGKGGFDQEVLALQGNLFGNVDVQHLGGGLREGVSQQ